MPPPLPLAPKASVLLMNYIPLVPGTDYPACPRRYRVFESRIRTCILRFLRPTLIQLSYLESCTARSGERLKSQVKLELLAALPLRHTDMVWNRCPDSNWDLLAGACAGRSGVSAVDASAWSENLMPLNVDRSQV